MLSQIEHLKIYIINKYKGKNNSHFYELIDFIQFNPKIAWKMFKREPMNTKFIPVSNLLPCILLIKSVKLIYKLIE